MQNNFSYEKAFLKLISSHTMEMQILVNYSQAVVQIN